MMSNEVSYQIEIKDNVLVFRTTSFKAEKGSVLHSGIYNRELASSLAAGACITLAVFFFAFRAKITAIHFIAALFLFAVFFLFFRTYIFPEPVLRVAINKKEGTIDVIKKTVFGEKKLSFPVSELDNIRQDYSSIAPENPDGIRLVERVALQHGTVIPGFGETSEFYTVELEFKNGRRLMIYSSGEPSTADDITTRLKNFIER